MILFQTSVNTFKKRNEKGFSLVEVLITLFVFTVGVLAVALLLDTSVQNNSSARFISEATEIAQHQMETLMNATYNDSELDASSSPYGPNAIANYNVSWTVQEDVPMAGMKTISLSVTWNDHGESKKVIINSIKQ